MKKTTLQKTVELSGIGLHTGRNIHITMRPTETATGIKFIRTDLEPNVKINADVNLVTDTTRSTSIGNGQANVATVEHLLSALAGRGVDNVNIELDGPEIPILDGSAMPFINAIEQAGLKHFDDDKDEFIIEETITMKDELSGSEIVAIPSDKFELQVIIDFPDGQVSEQSASLESIEQYVEEVANSRTFVFTNELEQLFDNGLIKGGDLHNAIVIAEKGLTQEKLDKLTTKFGVDKIELSKSGVLNEENLRFPNELARHKLLDLIGDLALLGKSIRGKIIAIKPGHRINTNFTALLKKKLVEARKLKGKPKYDPEQEPVLTVEQIQQMLPHRYPFLMVDKVIQLSEKHIVGIKNVTMNEAFFQGHFPGNAIFPGVLQMEALAQTGGIMALAQKENAGNWDTYFVKMDKVKFKAKVVPGDTLILKMELVAERRGIITMQGTAYVGNKIVSEGELTAQIIERTK